MKLIITRHGETEENKSGIMQGHLPGKLSATGIEQAKKIALRLKDEKIDYIFSSDLARASDTAKEIAKYHKHVPIKFTAELRERHLGDFQGKKESDFCKDPKNYKNIFIEPKNGEPMKELYARAKNFLQRIVSKYKDKTVLFVGHAVINKALIAVIQGKKSEDIWDIENPRNTEVNTFEIDKHRK
jgi:broad specificity phosphatase PhoE